MPRPPSSDPVKRFTISIPAAIYAKAEARMAEFGMDFSKYVQFLISTDARHRPVELQRLFIKSDGSQSYISARVSEEEDVQIAAEDGGTYGPKKAQPKGNETPIPPRQSKTG